MEGESDGGTAEDWGRIAIVLKGDVVGYVSDYAFIAIMQYFLFFSKDTSIFPIQKDAM